MAKPWDIDMMEELGLPEGTEIGPLEITHVEGATAYGTVAIRLPPNPGRITIDIRKGLSMAKGWLNSATRVPGVSAGPNVAGARIGICHHTSEGSTAAGCISAVRASNSWPHLTVEWTGTRLAVFQHMSLLVAARALQHPAGTPETNRAGLVQIEHVGFTDEAYRKRVGADPSLHVSRWSDARWAAIGGLCREIEAMTGCKPTTGVPLANWAHPNGWKHAQLVTYDQHTAHVFVKGNSHVDGTGFEIAKVCHVDDRAHRRLEIGDSGPDVRALQLAVRLRASRCGRPDHMPTADGVMGKETMIDSAFVAYVLGVGESQDHVMHLGHVGNGSWLSATTQAIIRDPSLRNNTQKRRATVRRPKHCKGA